MKKITSSTDIKYFVAKANTDAKGLMYKLVEQSKETLSSVKVHA